MESFRKYYALRYEQSPYSHIFDLLRFPTSHSFLVDVQEVS